MYCALFDIFIGGGRNHPLPSAEDFTVEYIPWDVSSELGQGWANVVDVGPTLTQLWNPASALIDDDVVGIIRLCYHDQVKYDFDKHIYVVMVSASPGRCIPDSWGPAGSLKGTSR